MGNAMKVKKTRKGRENKDINTLVQYLEQSFQFEGHPMIPRCLSTGLTATQNYNVHNLRAVEQKLLEFMIGNPLLYTFLLKYFYY